MQTEDKMIVGKLYMHEMSPPCRAVLLTAAALDIELDQQVVHVMLGETRSADYLKMNPQHTVPTYVDQDGTSIGDSHAIMGFLVDKYGKNDKLYAKDLGKRAAVNHLLHFDSGSLYALHYSIVWPMWMREVTAPSAWHLDRAETVYEVLNLFLEGQQWIAGTDNVTIADFSLSTTMMSINVVAPADSSRYPNIFRWLERCKALSYFDSVNEHGHLAYKNALVKLMNSDYDFLNDANKIATDNTQRDNNAN